MTLSKSLVTAVEIAGRQYPGFDMAGFKTKSRIHNYSHPRHYVWALLCANTNMSLTLIGRLSGGYHHTSILYASTKLYRSLGLEHFTQFTHEFKGVNIMDLDKQIAWAKKEYSQIRSEPRHMAIKYYELAMELATERDMLRRRVEMLTLRLNALGETTDTPPVTYAFENNKDAGEE